MASLGIIASLVWYILSQNRVKTDLINENEILKQKNRELQFTATEVQASNRELKDNISKLQDINILLRIYDVQLDANMIQQQKKIRKLRAYLTDLQNKFGIQENKINNYKDNLYEL